MSHVVTVDLSIEDSVDGLAALEAAAARLGMEFRRGQRTFAWYGRWLSDYHAQDAAYKHGIDPADYGTCEHALALPGRPGAYEVGIVRAGDGSLRVVFDFWDGSLRPVIGDSAGKLKQAYGLERARITARRLNYRVEEIAGPGEAITLIARRTQSL